MRAEFASTSRMWQFGQIADTLSGSRDPSTPQPPVGSTEGSVVPPAWLTIFRQPLATAQALRPASERYWARSDSAFGSLYASTMATVAVLRAVAAAVSP